MFNIELYDEDGFIYSEVYDNYESEKYYYRFNLKKMNNWDYYFQDALYKDNTEITNENYEVFVNSTIKKGDFLIINQHIEYLLHSSNSEKILSGNITATPLNSQQIAVLTRFTNQYVLEFFSELLNDKDVKDVELLFIWQDYVPKQFVDFIEKNK